MAQDLTLDEYTATFVFENIMPDIIAINNSDDDDSTKMENATNTIVGALCKNRSDDENMVKEISRNYIAKVRTIITHKDNVNGIIKYLDTTIKNRKVV